MKESTLRDSLIVSFASALVFAVLLFSGIIHSTVACVILGAALVLSAGAFAVLIGRLVNYFKTTSHSSVGHAA